MKVLLLDDQDMVRETLGFYLSRGGFDVVPASTAREAERLWEQDADIQLAVADFWLPEDVKGTDVIARLGGLRPSGKFLLVSGHPDFQVAIPERLEGRVKFLQKPFGQRELDSALRDLLTQPNS